jgi:hypothetical protein
MKVRLCVIAVLTLAALILAPYATAGASSVVYYDFENSLAPFLPDGAFGHSRTTVQQGFGDSTTCIAEHGQYFVQLTADTGRLVWMETSVPAQGPVTVRLNWNGRQHSLCDGCEFVAYAGSTPASPEDLSSAGLINWEWTNYRYAQTLNASGTAYVAVGLRLKGIGTLPLPPRAALDCLRIEVIANSGK